MKKPDISTKWTTGRSTQERATKGRIYQVIKQKAQNFNIKIFNARPQRKP